MDEHRPGEPAGYHDRLSHKAPEAGFVFVVERAVEISLDEPVDLGVGFVGGSVHASPGSCSMHSRSRSRTRWSALATVLAVMPTSGAIAAGLRSSR